MRSYPNSDVICAPGKKLISFDASEKLLTTFRYLSQKTNYKIVYGVYQTTLYHRSRKVAAVHTINNDFWYWEDLTWFKI